MSGYDVPIPFAIERLHELEREPMLVRLRAERAPHKPGGWDVIAEDVDGPTAEEIVAALAASEPRVELPQSETSACGCCGRLTPDGIRPIRHYLSCPYRMAVEWRERRGG